MRKRFSLKTKIALLFFAVSVLISIAYTVFVARRLLVSELSKIDLELMLAANSYHFKVE